jgi:hypothetical protein
MLDSIVKQVVAGGADAVTAARSTDNNGAQQVFGQVLQGLLGNAMKMVLGSVLGGL